MMAEKRYNKFIQLPLSLQKVAEHERMYNIHKDISANPNVTYIFPPLFLSLKDIYIYIYKRVFIIYRRNRPPKEIYEIQGNIFFVSFLIL